MSSFDYSIYYARFHNDSETHAESCADNCVGVLKPYLPDNHAANILDVGCGYGFALRALRRLGFYNLTGLEVSPQQAENCRKAGFKVELTNNSIEWISAHPKAFDCVVLFDVIEHVPVSDQIEFLRAIYRCLRPGGRIILTTPNANAILSSRWRYNDYTHHSSFTEHSLYFILKNAGFGAIHIEASKGLGRFSLKLWKRSAWLGIRKWIIRWCWLQVFKAEISWEHLEDISFELNHTAVAIKS